MNEMDGHREQHDEAHVEREYHHGGQDERERVADMIMENRIFAALSYVSVLFIVPMILRNENPEIAFHAKQGLVLFIAEVAVWFVLTILLNGFFAVLFPTGDFFLIRMLGAVAWLVFLGVSAWAIYNALRGKRWEIPFLSRLTGRVKL